MPEIIKHHGIIGMKWGVRRFQNADGSLTNSGKKRYEKADKKIRQFEDARSRNKKDYKLMKAQAAALKPNRERKKNAASKALYDTSEKKLNYSIAKQKAKKDPEYKRSPEYQRIKKEYGKQRTQKLLYGKYGHQRIETLKNQGYTEKQAKNRAYTEAALRSLVSSTAFNVHFALKER